MTNEKVMGAVLILFILGAAVYLTFSKFKQDIAMPTASPSPTPAALDFTLTKKPSPPSPAGSSAQTNTSQAGVSAQQSQPQEPPLLRNKRLSQFPGILKQEVLQNKKAVISTKKGVIELEIYPEATKAASNFMILASNGFYDNLTFHRVEDWVVQGGDPLGNGTGGPGYAFEDEPVTRPYKRGTLAMANAGPNTNGSQFFILKKDYPLPPNYTIFGSVLTGMEVVDKMSVGDIMEKVTILQHIVY